MKLLVLNPKKISLKKNIVNIFMEKCFLKLIEKKKLKKIKYKFFSKSNETYSNKNYELIFKQLLNEIYPQLNKIHNLNWNYKSWHCLIGPWLFYFIFDIINKIEVVKKIYKSDINIKNQILIGKSPYLGIHSFQEFKKKIISIDWNEKLFSRILYLLKNKKNQNIKEFNLSQGGKGKIENYNFIIKYCILILKIFERFFCINNKYLFYNTYLINKFNLFKINLMLGNFPFKHSFNFFNNILTKEPYDFKLRKKIKLNLNKSNNDFKILKILLIETMPSIYLEGFKTQLKLANESHLPKKIKKIFTSSFYEDSIFKFWIAKQINNNVKIYHGQHGAGFNIFKKNFNLYFEREISEKRLTWGSKIQNNKEINVGNYLINYSNTEKKVKNNKKFLILLPSAYVYKPAPYIPESLSFYRQSVETQNILDNINYKLINEVNIREHPKNKKIYFKKVLNLKKKSKFLSAKQNFQSISSDYSLLIFTYNSTEFYKQLALNKPCMAIITQNDLHKYINTSSQKDFNKMYDLNIIFKNGKELAKKINEIAGSVDNWWNGKKINKVKIEFCKKYSDKFSDKKFINTLL